MKKLLNTLAFVLIILTEFVSAQIMTPETLWKLKRISDPQLSPSGQQLLYNLRSFDVDANKGNSDIWLYDFMSKTSKVIAAEPENESSARWSADGKTVYYLTTKGGSSQLWSMNPDGSNKTQQTQLSGDIGMFGFSPLGNRIWFTMDVAVDKYLTKDIYPDLPKSSGYAYDDLMMRHWDTWADGTCQHIFVSGFSNGKLSGEAVDLLKGEPFDAPMKPHGGEEQISFSPDGNLLAYTCKKSTGREYALNTNSEIYLYDVNLGTTVNLTKGMMGYDKNPAFSPDGKSIAWISQEENGNEADLQRLFVMDLASLTKRHLNPGFEYNVESITWSSNSKKIYFVSGINATEQIFSFDFNEKKSNPIRQLTSDLADYTALSLAAISAKEDRIVATRHSMLVPAELYSINLSTGQATQIGFNNQEILDAMKFPEIKKRMVTTTDGKQMLTWVLYPPDFDATKKYPTLLYCQGGPQSTVSQFFSYRWNLHLMAASGYIVVAPNRRGLPGFGRAWNDEISGDWGGQCMKDLLSAIDDVSKEAYVDTDHLGSVGASFGGYSVFWLAGNHNKRFKAFISHCGVYNLESMIATEELFFYNHEFEGPYWNTPTPRSFVRDSPHRYVKNWDTPILIISNEKDYRVPYTQGLEAYSAARMQNVPARFVNFPDEGHWVVRPQNSLAWQREFYNWLNKYLKK